jgi:hypothetical protein
VTDDVILLKLLHVREEVAREAARDDVARERGRLDADDCYTGGITGVGGRRSVCHFTGEGAEEGECVGVLW